MNPALPPVPGLFDHDSDLEEKPAKSKKGFVESRTFQQVLKAIERAVRVFCHSERPDDKGRSPLFHLGWANYLAGFLVLRMLQSCCAPPRPPGLPRGVLTLLLALRHNRTALYVTELPSPDQGALRAAVHELAQKLRPAARTVEDVRRALNTTESTYNTQGYDLYAFVHSAPPNPAITARFSTAPQHRVCNCLCRTMAACLVAEDLGMEPVVSRSCVSQGMRDFCRRGAKVVRRGDPGVHHFDNLRSPPAPGLLHFAHYDPLKSKLQAVEDLLLMPVWATLVDFLLDRESCLGAQGEAAHGQLLACFDALRAAAQKGSGHDRLGATWQDC